MTATADLSPGFWDNLAPKYAAQPIADQQAYRATLDHTSRYLTRRDNVLELGCGTGPTALTLAPRVGRYLATDVSAGMIAQARTRQIKAPGTPNLTFETATPGDARLTQATPFDAVLAFNLLHLLPDLDADLARIHDMLPWGGVFISKTPSLPRPGLNLKYRALKGVFGMMHLIGKAPGFWLRPRVELRERITRAGFDIIERADYPDKAIPNHFIVARRA